MGKRSHFERKERDFYRTPKEAVAPLLPHLPLFANVCEPCAGDGLLVSHLTEAGWGVTSAFDIEPQAEGIETADATKLRVDDCDIFITNPPWNRLLLHPIIENLASQKPTWLLFDADWAHTKQSSRYKHLMTDIVSIGRVKWFPDTNMSGKDNCAWYRFAPDATGYIRFWGR